LKQELATLQAKHHNVISICNEKINRANHTIKAKNEEIKNLTQKLASNNLDISERQKYEIQIQNLENEKNILLAEHQTSLTEI